MILEMNTIDFDSNDNDDHDHHTHLLCKTTRNLYSNSNSDSTAQTINDNSIVLNDFPLSPSRTPPTTIDQSSFDDQTTTTIRLNHRQTLINCDDIDVDDHHHRQQSTTTAAATAIQTSQTTFQINRFHHHHQTSMNLVQNHNPRFKMNNQKCMIINTSSVTPAQDRQSTKSLMIDHHQQQHQQNSYQNKLLIARKILELIRNDDYEQLSMILKYTKPDDLNVFINGQTALHYCLLLGRDISWLKLLVLNGANPNLSNQDGWHPLHLAAFRGLKDIVNYLTNCNNNFAMINDDIDNNYNYFNDNFNLNTNNANANTNRNNDNHMINDNIINTGTDNLDENIHQTPTTTITNTSTTTNQL